MRSKQRSPLPNKPSVPWRRCPLALQPARNRESRRSSDADPWALLRVYCSSLTGSMHCTHSHVIAAYSCADALGYTLGHRVTRAPAALRQSLQASAALSLRTEREPHTSPQLAELYQTLKGPIFIEIKNERCILVSRHVLTTVLYVKINSVIAKVGNSPLHVCKPNPNKRVYSVVRAQSLVTYRDQ